MTSMYTETCLAAVKTKLEAISDGSTTWASTRAPFVTRAAPDGKAPPTNDLIWIRHTETSAFECSTGASALYRVDVAVSLYWYFDAPTWNPDTDTQTITHDVYKALRDWTLGGLVDLLEIVGVFPVTPSESEDPSCRVRVDLTLRYRVDRNDPNTRK